MSVRDRIAQLQRQQEESIKTPPKEVQVKRLGEDRLKLKSNATSSYQGIQTDPNALDEDRLKLLRMEYESYLRDVGKLDITLSFDEWISKQREVGRLNLSQPSDPETPQKQPRRLSFAPKPANDDGTTPASPIPTSGLASPTIIISSSASASTTDAATASLVRTASLASAAAPIIVPTVSVAERARRLSSHALAPPSSPYAKSPRSSSSTRQTVSPSIAVRGISQTQTQDAADALSIAKSDVSLDEPVSAGENSLDVAVGSVVAGADAEVNAAFVDGSALPVDIAVTDGEIKATDNLESSASVKRGSVAARAALFAQSRDNAVTTRNDDIKRKTVSTDIAPENDDAKTDSSVNSKVRAVASRLSIGNQLFSPAKPEKNDSGVTTEQEQAENVVFAEEVDFPEKETTQKPKPGRLSIDRLAALSQSPGMFTPEKMRPDAKNLPFPGSPSQGLTVKQIRAMRNSLGQTASIDGNVDGNASVQTADAVQSTDASDTSADAKVETVKTEVGGDNSDQVNIGASPMVRKPRMHVDRRLSSRVAFNDIADAYEHPHSDSATHISGMKSVTEEAQTLPQIEAQTVSHTEDITAQDNAHIATIDSVTATAVDEEPARKVDENEAQAHPVDEEANDVNRTDEAVTETDRQVEEEVLAVHATEEAATVHASDVALKDVQDEGVAALSTVDVAAADKDVEQAQEIPAGDDAKTQETSESAAVVVIESALEATSIYGNDASYLTVLPTSTVDVDSVPLSPSPSATVSPSSLTDSSPTSLAIVPIVDINSVSFSSPVPSMTPTPLPHFHTMVAPPKSVAVPSVIPALLSQSSVERMEAPVDANVNDDTVVSDSDSVVGDNDSTSQSFFPDDDTLNISVENAAQFPLNLTVSPVSTTSTDSHAAPVYIDRESSVPISDFARFHTENTGKRAKKYQNVGTMRPSHVESPTSTSNPSLSSEAVPAFDTDIDNDHQDFSRVINDRLILDSVPQVTKATMRAAVAMHETLSQTGHKDAMQVRIMAARSVSERNTGDHVVSNVKLTSSSDVVSEDVVPPTPVDSQDTSTSDSSRHSWTDAVWSWWPWILAAAAAGIATRTYVTRNSNKQV